MTDGSPDSPCGGQEIRLLLADDHDVVLQGICAALQERCGFRVIASATSGSQAITLALSLKPDIVVMDVSMPDMNGVEATKAIKSAMPGARIVIYQLHVTHSS